MELSDEQKQRIIDDERRRIAEEQYREQVRRELLGVPTPPVDPDPPLLNFHHSHRKGNVLRNIFIGVAAVAGLSILVFNYALRRVVDTPVNGAANPAIKSSPSETARASEPKGSDTAPAPARLTTAEIAERALPSVVVIENIDENGQKAGHGSGYVMSDDGMVVTNYHVVRGATALNVRLRGDRSHRIDSILAYDTTHDVAILQVPSITARPLASADRELVKVGEKVVAIGAPLGLESTVSEGIVSAIRDLNGTRMIQTTSSISPGSSGGPLLNEYGHVIGLTTANIPNGQSLNLAVASRYVAELAGNRRAMTLPEMLAETKTTLPIAANTFSVPARGESRLRIDVLMESGAVLTGSYAVTGGSGNDVDVFLITADNRIVINSGRVSGTGQINIRLPRGTYFLLFRNQFSTFTSKSVSPDVSLSYYR